MVVLYDLVNCRGNQRNVMTSARTALQMRFPLSRKQGSVVTLKQECYGPLVFVRLLNIISPTLS
jgi:hypothetical protein